MISLLAQTFLDFQANISSTEQQTNIFFSSRSSHLLKVTSPLLGLLLKSMRVVVTLKVYRGNVVEMGMNIANLSLDRVGEKAQGINRVLISIINQQEEGEKEKGEDMYERDRKRKMCFIFFLLRRAQLHFLQVMKFRNHCKGANTNVSTPPPQAAPHAFFFYLSSVI